MKQSKNSKFTSIYKGSSIDFETQISLRRLAPPNIRPSKNKPLKKDLWKIKAPGLIFGILRYFFCWCNTVTLNPVSHHTVKTLGEWDNVERFWEIRCHRSQHLNKCLTVGQGLLVKFLRRNLTQTTLYHKPLQSTKIQIHVKWFHKQTNLVLSLKGRQL